MIDYCKHLPGASLLESSAGCWFAAFFLFFSFSFANGQTIPANQKAPAPVPTAVAATDQAPSMSTNVDEVSLDLVVHDKNHNAILDLKPEDIVVTDNNAPVKLTGFHLVKADAGAGHMITLLFDPFHGPTAKSARNLAEKILAVLPAAGYSFSVLDFSDRLRLIQSFTDDRSAVGHAVNVVTESQAIALTSTHSLAIDIVNDQKADAGRTKAASEAERNLIAIAQTGTDLTGRHVDVKERARAQSLVTALQDSQVIAKEQHAQLNLAGLLALVKSQQRIGDRKALIYFTQNQQMNAAQKVVLKAIGSAAERAGVSIYAVDMNPAGNSSQYQEANALLNGSPPYNPARMSDGTIPLQQEYSEPIHGDPCGAGLCWLPKHDILVMTDFMRSSGEDRTDPFADTKNPMAGLAKGTGGGYIDALNSTRKSLQQMVQDLSTYYQATYVPPFKDYDGAFRTIGVKPLRVGLNVRTKTGYFALAPGAEAGIRPFELPLLKILAEPQLPGGLKFHAAILRFGDLPDGNTNTLAVEVPLNELETKRDVRTHAPAVHVSIVAQIKDTSGVVVEHYGEDITNPGAKETLDHDHSATISLARHFISSPGKYTMEVAVVDQNSGKTSAQRTGFEIPDVAGAVSLSDMVLVRKIEDSPQEDIDPLEPLRYEHQKVTANITGELTPSAKGVSLFFILHPEPAGNDPLSLEMEVIRNGKPGKRTPLLQADGVHAAIPYLASFGSGALSPGAYEVKAYLGQGGKTATQSETFSVPGAAGAGAGAGAADEITKGIEGAAIDSDRGNEPLETPPHAQGQLAITMLPNPVPALSKDEAQRLIENARQRALDYNETLPSFMCIEVTNRSIDPTGSGRWKSRDTIVESLRYRDEIETRKMLEVNGEASNVDREAMKGALSAGEFGGVLQSVFRNEAKADFQWQETESLNGGAVQVYNYRVDRRNSLFSVTASNGKQLIVGFHGQVYIDSASRRARRITLIADDLPPDFPTHATSIGVDYDYVPIDGLKYLMPVSAELKLRQGQNQAVTNTMEFRDYKRFGPM